MILSEKSHQKISDYIQFLFKQKVLNLIKKGIISREKSEIQVIISKIMLTRSSEKICNPMRFTGFLFMYVWM